MFINPKDEIKQRYVSHVHETTKVHLIQFKSAFLWEMIMIIISLFYNFSTTQSLQYFGWLLLSLLFNSKKSTSENKKCKIFETLVCKAEIKTTFHFISLMEPNYLNNIFFIKNLNFWLNSSNKVGDCDWWNGLNLIVKFWKQNTTHKTQLETNNNKILKF